MSRTESLFSCFPSIDRTFWKERVLKELKGAEYSKIVWKSPDGFEIEPWYNRESAVPAARVPFARLSNHWTICQQISLCRLASDPSLLSESLTGGAESIEFLFDDRTASGTIETLFNRLQEIDLVQIPVYLSGAIDNPSQLLERLSGLPGFNSNRGALLGNSGGPASLFNLTPGHTSFRSVAVDTVRFHAAGATIIQELAIALAGISDCLAGMTAAAIDATEAASRITIVTGCGTSHFAELAKLRALRAMWPQLLAAYGVSGEAIPEPHLFVRASTRSFSILDPYTNMLRLSTEALSAILGGCDTLQLATFDPAGSVPEGFAERITRNIHLLCREESGLDRVIDPAAGSYYIETMTTMLCHEAWKLFRHIEAEGGLSVAESCGSIATMITEASEARRKAVDTRRRTLVGINRFTVSPLPEVIAALNKAPDRQAGVGYEQLRVRMLAHSASGGMTPRAALWQHGEPSKSSRVAAFAEDFLRSGGFEVLPPVTLDLKTCNCRALLNDEPDIVVLCWSGDSDLTIVPDICQVIQELRKETVIVMAAKPPEHAELLIRAGIDRFIHLGSNACADLLSLQHKTGVL
jgi:methylmalonyl-CoA mutase